MDTTTLLVIVLVVLALGGGGWFYARRVWIHHPAHIALARRGTCRACA